MDPKRVIHSDPEILGGTPVFVGTRVPLRNLIDYLERDYSVDQFLDAFPTVSRDQALQALENAHDLLAADARSAPGIASNAPSWTVRASGKNVYLAGHTGDPADNLIIVERGES